MQLTMMSMTNPGNYRLRLLLDLFQVLVLPVIVLSSFPHIINNINIPLPLPLSSFFSSSPSLSLPIHILFIFLWNTALRLLNSLSQSFDRHNLGAKPIPCVKGKWPGNIDVLLRMMQSFKRGYILDVYLQLFEEYRCTTLNLNILWRDHIITMDQEHTKFVLATGFQHFWRGRYQKERMERFLGRGIFNRDDEVWSMHRANTRPFFARERISDFHSFETFTSRTLDIISNLSTPSPLVGSYHQPHQPITSAPFDAQDLFSRFALDTSSSLLFGQNLDTLSSPLPIAFKSRMGPKGSEPLTQDPDSPDLWGSFAHAFEAAQQVTTHRARLGSLVWPILEFFKDRNKGNVEVIHRWLDPLVEQAIGNKKRMMESGVVSPIGEKTFLEHLADSTDDPVMIRDQLLSLLLASRDTTACLLTFVTYFMAIYPDIAQKMRTEVLEQCGRNPSTYEQIKNLRYMKAVLNETLRLYPPVPLNVRESRSSSSVFPRSDPTFASTSSSSSDMDMPLYMPGSTPIMFLPLLTQRNKSLWGPDADVFDPERWIDPRRTARFVANPTMFTPFSAGPRICLGQNYAYNEASYFLVRLLQEYDTFTLAPEAQPLGSLPPSEWKSGKGRQVEERIWPGAALTLFVKGGLWVRFGKASNSIPT
ncbi:cytochrome P450 monooxygenase CYP63 [Dendrothele bispora CBS 962.96]|uniref:Cytochrome P450 monooxygenase CYP63 n=1 Tax=Dendrothele bispora (strain CBS 962.96) TaxID=1314807 RepID=A0A4S8MJI5_DENBC|nr:cytochrome P450 monooxygenase CYP63 [Dendrothele bispora CBS 962.96]